MIFQRCTENDLKKTIGLYHRVIKHLEETVNYPQWSDAHPSDESIRQAFASGELYICKDGDTVAGAAVMSEDPEGDYGAGDWSRELSPGEFLIIHVLASHPDYARKGVGGILVDGCLDVAKKAGYRAVRLDVVPENLPAVGLYQKHGFSYAGTKSLNRPGVDIPLFDLYEYNL